MQSVMREFLILGKPASPNPSSLPLSSVDSRCKPRNAEATWGRRGLCHGPPLLTNTQGESLGWHEHSFQPPHPYSKEASTETADLAQNHLWQPCDSSVTATRFLGEPVCSTVSQKKKKQHILAPLTWGLEKGRQRLLRLAGFQWSLTPEYRTQRINSSILLSKQYSLLALLDRKRIEPCTKNSQAHTHRHAYNLMNRLNIC